MNTDYNSEIPSQEWVENRRNYAGGSEIAAICGESSFKTPLQVWMRKNGLIEPDPSNPIADFGNVFEPVMDSYFQEITGLKTRRVNRPFVHGEHDFLRAHIDRQILNGADDLGTMCLELKTTTSHRLKKLADAYPKEWYYQIQFYLALTGYKKAYLFIYTRDDCQFYEPILIERAEEFITEIMAKVIQWWKIHMINGKRPEPQNEEDLLILYPNSSDGKVIETTPRDFAIYQELKEVREQKSDLKEKETALKNELKASLGDAERLVCRGETLVSWKTHSRRSLDRTRLREEQPEVYSDYLTESSYRRFSVK